MSLILDALRKLEREKRSPQRGFVVVGAPRASRPHGALAGALAAAAVLVPLTWWLATRAARPAEPPTPGPAGQLTGPATSPSVREPEPRAPGSVPAATSSPPASAPAIPPGRVVEAPAVPRRSPTPAASVASAWVLQAITQRDGRPVALINDRLVREGDSLNGARVVRIGEAEVELEVGGRRIVLSF